MFFLTTRKSLRRPLPENSSITIPHSFSYIGQNHFSYLLFPLKHQLRTWRAFEKITCQVFIMRCSDCSRHRSIVRNSITFVRSGVKSFPGPSEYHSGASRRAGMFVCPPFSILRNFLMDLSVVRAHKGRASQQLPPILFASDSIEASPLRRPVQHSNHDGALPSCSILYCMQRGTSVVL